MLKRTNKIINLFILFQSNCYQKRCFINYKKDFYEDDNRIQPSQYIQKKQHLNISNNGNNKNNNNDNNNGKREKEDREQIFIKYRFSERFLLKIIFFLGSFFLFDGYLLKNANYPHEKYNSIYEKFKKNSPHYVRYVMSDQDYQLINEEIYNLGDTKAFYIIYVLFNLDKFSQIKLIESGINKYCIDYLLKNGDINNENINKEIISASLPKSDIFYKKVVFKSIESFSKEYNNNKIEFRNQLNILYKKIIIMTMEYNSKYGLSNNNIKLPTQLEYLKNIKIQPSDNNSILKLSEFISNERKSNFKTCISGVGLTFLYMSLFRTNKIIFSNFPANRFINTIFASLSTGAFLFSDMDKRVYENETKQFLNKFIPWIPNEYKQFINNDSWFIFTILSSFILSIPQYRLYFIIPYFSYFSFLKSSDKNNIMLDQ